MAVCGIIYQTRVKINAQRVGELGLGIPFSSDINSSEKCLLAQGSVTLGCHDVREYDKQMRKD